MIPNSHNSEEALKRDGIEDHASARPRGRLEIPEDLAPLMPPEEFGQSMDALDIALEPRDINALGRYLTMLLHVNTQFNLTGVRDADESWVRHIADSLTLLPLLISADAHRVIDVGSGGGLPGIPLAICLPEIEFTLLEATGKKAAFLSTVAHRLELRNVRVVNDRAEVVGQDHRAMRESFDVAIARAVGPMPVLLELTIPLVRIGGFVLAVKGAQADREIADAKQALHMLHSHVTQTHRTATGTIVVVEKQRKTPRIYPRRPGEPKRMPLGGVRG